MKKILLLLCLTSFALHALAGNAEDARATLDKVAAVVGNKSGASASFTISGGKIGRQTGSIAIKGSKFRARTPKVTVWYNGKTQWTYMASANEVNVAAPSAAKQQTMNPYSFISLYKSGYKLSQKMQGKTRLVHMIATGQKAISEMYITVDSKYVPTQVRMLQKGQWITIQISNFSKKAIPDKEFEFNSKDYPKAEIIDLR
ncbi:MAG: hypothetical protein NC116_07220 [Clostridium sp.]|nr:hypothetical protein [Clostridium sp.]